MSTPEDETSLNGRLRPRKSRHNNSFQKQLKKTRSRSIDQPKTNEPPEVGAPVKELPKDSAPAKEPPKAKVPAKEPPKASTSAKEPTEVSALAKELPKASAPEKEPSKSKAPAKELSKASAPAKEPPKAKTPAKDSSKASASVKEPPKPKVKAPAKEPPKASASAKEPPIAKVPAKEPPKASTSAKEPPEVSALAKELSKASAPEKEPPKSKAPAKEPPKLNDDLAKKSDFSATSQFLCSYCDKIFGSKIKFTKHVESVHPTSPKQVTFVCLFCEKSEPDTSNIISHMINNHPNQYFACIDCKTRFPSASKLAEHKLVVCKKVKTNKKILQIDPASRQVRKRTKKLKEEVNTTGKELQDSPSFNGIVISCELKSTQVHDNADIEDHISTNVILPPSKSLAETSGLDKGTVIVLDDVQWNKRIPPNFSFQNSDADQILSRLGVVHRSPRTGESSRRDFMKKIDNFAVKFEKCFETSFYSKVASNVQENLTKFLDGTFNFNPDPDKAIKTRKAKNSVVINTAEGFPILLARQQFTRSDFDCYMPRAIAPKHKWKWDNLDNEKTVLSVDQIKRDNHTNNCIITLVSSLDIWTQLCMRRKFEGKFGSKPVEKKTEKQMIIGNELKNILESREITSSSSQEVKWGPPLEISELVVEPTFPLSLGLRPRTVAMQPAPAPPPAVLSGECVRPRCFVCCACGDQTSDGRTLTLHISTHHPNAQVQHYEIVGEQLLNADILKHLYVPPSQVANRTRPLRGIKECTKCQKQISLEELHQHMLDCAGDTPAVRRRQARSRPFGVRRRRPRVPGNASRTRIRKGIRSKQRRQKNIIISRPKIRTEVGDGETIRKMLADLPAKRHRVLVNASHKISRPLRMVNHQMNKLMIKRRVSDQLSGGVQRRPASKANKTSNTTTTPHRTKRTNKPKTNFSSGKEDEDDEDDKPLKPKKRPLNNLRTRINDMARKVALTKAKRRSLRVIQKSASNNDVPEPPTQPDVENQNRKEDTTSNITEPPAVTTPKKNEIIKGGYNTRQTANSGDSYSNYSRQSSGYNTRHQSGGNEGSSNNNSQKQDPGGAGYNTRQNSGSGDDYSYNSRSGGYNSRHPPSGSGGDHPHNMTHGYEYCRSGYNTRERANRCGSSNRGSRDQRPPPALGPPPGPPRPERVAPLAPPGIPLKHSIARLTANSETHDKAVQFTHCFLVQQECNNIERASSGPLPLFDETMTQKLDKPPISYSDRSVLDLCALQKNKLNKPKKGLNDCIAMLKNKLVEPNPPGHVSVQCGPDEPMSPMHLTSSIRPISKEAMMITPKPDHQEKKTATVNIETPNDHFNTTNKAEIQTQVHHDQMSFLPPRSRPPTASAVLTRRHSTEQKSRNRSSRQISVWDNAPRPDISLVRRRTNSSSSDKTMTPTRESKPSDHRVSVSMTDPMHQSTVDEYHSELQLLLPKSVEVKKVKPTGSQTRSSTRPRRQSNLLDYNYRKSVADFNWQGSYHSRTLSDGPENIPLMHHNYYVQPVDRMPAMHTSAYGQRSEKNTATHHSRLEEYEKIQAIQNLNSEQTLIKISPSCNITYDQAADKTISMLNHSYDQMYDKLPVTYDPSYDQTMEKIQVMRDYSYKQTISGCKDSRSASQKYAEVESVKYRRIHEDISIYPEEQALDIIPSAYASTNIDSVISTPLDLSGKITDVPKQMSHDYGNYKTLDLSKKSTDIYGAPLIDDVVDLRVRNYDNQDRVYCPSITTMIDPETVNELSFQSLPTDLSLRFKRDDVDVHAVSSQKRMKTRSENCFAPTRNLLIESEQIDTDINRKLNKNIQYSLQTTTDQSSYLPKSKKLDPILSNISVLDADIIRKLNENDNIQRSLQHITEQSSYGLKSKNITDSSLSTNSQHIYQKVPKYAGKTQPKYENIGKFSSFPSIGLTTHTMEAKTIPKRRPSCTVTSQSLVQAAQEASCANPNVTFASPTIASLESFYALMDTHNKVAEHATSIESSKRDDTLFGSSDICNRGIPNITRPEQYKITMKDKLSNKATTVYQDPETAKKIAMLPRELVEILGTMPVDHRNQLLNVLPQYVATTMASPLSLPDTVETHTSAVTRSKPDENEHDIAMPITPLKIKASHLSRQSCETIFCDNRSNTLLTPSSPVSSELQFDTTSVKLANTDNSTSPSLQAICESKINSSAVVTDPTIHQHDIQRTADSELQHCNEAIKAATDLSLSVKKTLPEPILIKFDRSSRPNNEQTASLRAVRIRAQTDRQKDNQPVKEIPAGEILNSKITEEMPESILTGSKGTPKNKIQELNFTEESKHDLSLENQLFLVVHHADTSSTKQANKQKPNSDIRMLPIASLSQTAVENTNNEQSIQPKDKEMTTQPKIGFGLSNKKLIETIPDRDNANIEPNNVSLTPLENQKAYEGEFPNFNKILPGISLKSESYKKKNDSISIDCPQHEKNVNEADSEDDVSLATIAKLKQRDIKKTSKVSISRDSTQAKKNEVTKHRQQNKKCKAAHKHTLLKNTKKAGGFIKNLEIDIGPAKNIRSDLCNDDLSMKKDSTNKSASDNEQSSLDSLRILKPASGEDLSQGVFPKSTRKIKAKKPAKKMKNEGPKKVRIKNESKPKQISDKVLQTNDGDVKTVKSFLNSKKIGSDTNKDSSREDTLIGKYIEPDFPALLEPCVHVPLQSDKDVKSDEFLTTSVESLDLLSDKALSHKILIESQDQPIDKDKPNRNGAEIVSLQTKKEISFSTDKNVEEIASVTTCTSLTTAPAIVDDIKYAVIPLRRSRRAKSVFTDSKLIELNTSTNIHLSLDYKPPVTKKQLIFSKLLLDEENHLKSMIPVSEPGCDSKKVPTIDNSNGCTSKEQKSSETYNTSSDSDNTVLVSKSQKRKKSPQNRTPKKKMSLDASSVPQKLSNPTNISKVTKNETVNSLPNAKNSNNALAYGLQNYKVTECDRSITVVEKQSFTSEKRKNPVDDTESKAKKLKLAAQMLQHDLKTSHLNKPVQENVESTAKLPCYSVQTACRRTRSKSVNIKLYDPYDIDLDDMIEYEPLRKSFKSHLNKNSKLKVTNLDINMADMACLDHEKTARVPRSTTLTNAENSNQSDSVIINDENIPHKPDNQKDINVLAKTSECSNENLENIDVMSMLNEPTALHISTQDNQHDIKNTHIKHSEKENVDSDDSSKSDVPLVKYIEEKAKKQLIESNSNNITKNKNNELKKCNEDKHKMPAIELTSNIKKSSKKSIRKGKSLASIAKRQNIKNKQKKVLTLSSNSTDDEKSDVPLQKLIDEKKRKQSKRTTLNNVDCEKSINKKHKITAKPKVKAPVAGTKTKNYLNKNIKKPVQHAPSTPTPLKSDDIASKNETDEQLRSEKFMESFGFFSERKPRKSNLIAARKIAETFHNANESDAMFLKRMSRDSNPPKKKIPTEKFQVKSPYKTASEKKIFQKKFKGGPSKIRQCSCRPCQKRFSRPDSLMRHRLTYCHVSKLSQFQMNFRTQPAPEEPNFLVALKQQAKRFNILLDPTKNKDNKQAILPSLHNIVSEAFRDVREQKLSLIGFTREEALFIDCCELLNRSEIAKLVEEVPHPNPNRMCLGKCTRPPKLKVKRIKNSCKRNEVKAKKRARKKEEKNVMNVEKHLETYMKESSTATKTSIQYQEIAGPSKSSLQRVKTCIQFVVSPSEPGPSRQKTERVAINNSTEAKVKHGLPKIPRKKIETITSDNGAENSPIPSNNSHKNPEICIENQSKTRPTGGPSTSLNKKTEIVSCHKGKNTILKPDGFKKSNINTQLVTSRMQPKPGPSNHKITEDTIDKITESQKSVKSHKKIKSTTVEKCSKTSLKSDISKKSRRKMKRINRKNQMKSGVIANLREKAVSEITSDKCIENQSKPSENVNNKNSTITIEKSEHQSKPGAPLNSQRIKNLVKDKCTSNPKLVPFQKSTAAIDEKSVDFQPKPGPSKTTHQDTDTTNNAKYVESQQKYSEYACFESETETLSSSKDKCALHKKDRRNKKTQIATESQPNIVPFKNSSNSFGEPTGEKHTGTQLKSSSNNNSCLKTETVNNEIFTDIKTKSISATGEKVTKTALKLGSSKVTSKRTETVTNDESPESQLKSSPSQNSIHKTEIVNSDKCTDTEQGAEPSKNSIQKIANDTHESQLKTVSFNSKKPPQQLEIFNSEKGAENQENTISLKEPSQKTDTCAGTLLEKPCNPKKSQQRLETVTSETLKYMTTLSNTDTKENENQMFKIKEFMYPEETVDLFEDKFDKIKRKCRSQAAAAKQSTHVVEPITGQNSETEESKTKKKLPEKKAKKNYKMGNKSILTKGALKGFDEVKMSIGKSELDEFTTEPSLETSIKKRKKRSKKKKQKRLLKSNRKYESGERTKPKIKLDVYEFFDEETELLELRPSTLMERFKNIAKKETSSTSKQSKETSSTGKQLNESSIISKQLLHASQDQKSDDSSNSMSDGDDFVYMSDDYVASDDETENSLISDIGIVKGDGKKAVSPAKKKEVTEKNAVMGKIFKHNAVRAEKKEKRVQSDVQEKPQANLDQLFDSLLKDIPTVETLPHQNDNTSPKVSSRSPSLSPSIESLTETTTRCLSPEIYDHPTPKKEIKPRLVASTIMKSASTYDFDCVPSTSTKREVFVLSDDFTGSHIHTGTFEKKKRDTTFIKTYSSDDDADYDNLLLASGSRSRKSSPVFECSDPFIASSDFTIEDAGVARQRARRKCTVGKQNILAESWSSESETESGPVRPNSTETVVARSNRKKKGRKVQSGIKRRHKQVSGKKQEENRVANINRRTSTGCAGISGFKGNIGDVEYETQTSAPMPVANKADVYDWDMEQEAEEQAQREREQHGWIVGGSHKKLVTMLAHAKGRKRNHDTYLLE